MKIKRKDKKKLRDILLCHTGNVKCSKLKISRESWFKLRVEYDVWFNCFDMEDRRGANAVRRYRKNGRKN